METGTGSIEFTLTPATLSFAVAVRLRRAGERWVAQVGACGQQWTGLAPSARAALAAALEPLGDRASTVLTADLGLLEPSVRVARLEPRGACR